MSKAYTELYYHLVWSTWNRKPLLEQKWRQALYPYVGRRCQAYGYHLYAVNGIEDHLHVVVRLDPAVSIAEAVGKLKGSSSHFCNRELDMETVFKWQEGYGAFTFGKRDLPEVVAYVEGQVARHQGNQLDPDLEDCGEAQGVRG
jgi:REP element-mobilizing transposase RayT